MNFFEKNTERVEKKGTLMYNVLRWLIFTIESIEYCGLAARKRSSDMLQTENKNGVITVDESVIVSIVANVAKDCFGIVEMESKNASEEFWSLFKRNPYDKGIYVTFDENIISIDLHIMVSYGINIPAITESIVHKVTYTVEQITGFTVKTVNVFVDSISTK